MSDLFPRVGATERRLAVALLVVSLVTGTLVAGDPAAAGSVADARQTSGIQAANSAEGVAGVGQTGDESPANDSTTRPNDSPPGQVNPAELEEDGSLGSVEAWLVDQLGSRFERSSANLSEGQYDAAAEAIGEEYREEYERYADVADRMEDGPSNTTALERAQRRQQAFLTAMKRYDRTYDRYRAARDNGSDARARRLARQLRRYSNRVERRSDSLLGSLREAENTTDANLTESRRVVRNRTANVTARQREVERESFVGTELSATATGDDRTASFTDPLVVAGRLRAANGTPLANRTATFRVGNETATANTNATGGFRLAYRPASLPANASAVTVRYVPDNDSVYRTSNASLPVTVRQVEPTVRITDAPDSVAYNRTVRVRGSVTVEGTPVAGVPVRLTASDEFLGNATTAGNGSFVLSGRFSEADAGNRSSLRVSLALRDAALAAESATTTVPVERVGTAVSLNASRNGTTLQVAGRLTTEDGEPLGDRAVHVRVDENAALAVVETNDAGRYDATISVPESARKDGNVTASATFDGSRGLTRAQATETVAFPSPGGPASLLADAVHAAATAPWWALLLVGSAIALVAYAAARRFRPDRDEPATGGGPLASGNGSRAHSDADSGGASRTLLLSLACQQLDRDDPESAVETVYAAVRRRLVDQFGADHSVTHAELYALCRDGGLPDDRLDALRRVTQAYERARFSSQRLSTETAETALRAGSLLAEETGTETGTEAGTGTDGPATTEGADR
ncbi:HEPN domain-containing protein [Halorussus salinisoli]|uniref:hypothetical protein n=1 Tax=Halorussus salinisoli TaxID=2558242 RepID=UPI0010C15F37|nr:hypothetical protein [Halorussus salinisoli]